MTTDEIKALVAELAVPQGTQASKNLPVLLTSVVEAIKEKFSDADTTEIETYIAKHIAPQGNQASINLPFVLDMVITLLKDLDPEADFTDLESIVSVLCKDQGNQASKNIPVAIGATADAALRADFEIYADEACTIRPVAGQEYDSLYMKVKHTTQIPPTTGVILMSNNDTELNLAGPFTEAQEDPFVATLTIQVGGDIPAIWMSEDYDSNPFNANAVIKLNGAVSVLTIPSDAVFSFNMPPAPVHDIEIWADEACTIRPVTGQEYTDLYLQANTKIEWRLSPIYIGVYPSVVAFIDATEEDPGVIPHVELYVDWSSEEIDWATLDAGTVLRCHTSSPTTLEADVFSFRPSKINY